MEIRTPKRQKIHRNQQNSGVKFFYDPTESLIPEDFPHIASASEWLAKCPSIDLVTQAPTKKGVLVAVQEAVSLWFESCIGRNVLTEALEELGFDKSPWDVKNDPLPRSNFIAIRERAPEEIPKDNFSFFVDSRKNNDFSVEGFIPAYLVREQLGEFLHEAA